MKDKAIIKLENISKEEKKAWKKKEKRKERLVFLFCLLFNLGILIVLKYSFFLGTNLNHFLRVWISLGNFLYPNLFCQLEFLFILYKHYLI